MNQTNALKLNQTFFKKSSYDLAIALLGKVLVRKLEDGTMLRAKIVETECYPGGNDKASHSYNGRKTKRNAPMYMDAGTLYVYFTYGMYYCVNISSVEPGGAVLLRALEPLEGDDRMQILRQSSKKNINIMFENLCNGPAKLCIALDVNKNNTNAKHICQSDDIWIEENDEICRGSVAFVRRIGIDSTGQEAVDKLYRFYIIGNRCVSKRDRCREKNFELQS